METSSAGGTWRAVLREAADVLFPVACAGCAAPGTTLCASCRSAFTGAVIHRSIDGLPVLSVAEWDDVTGGVMRAFKRDGTPALARALGGPLRAAALQARADAAPSGRVALVPVPSRRAAYRTRGFRPVELLLRGARLPWTPALAVRARVADQRLLSRAERAENLRHAFRVIRVPRDVAGVLIVDDVVTTGATMASAALALAEAGVPVLGGVSVLSTPRRDSSEKDR